MQRHVKKKTGKDYKLFLLTLAFSLFMLGALGCASMRIEDDTSDGEGLPWNSPATWEDRMPMGAPY